MGGDDLRLPTHSVTVDLLRAGGDRERVELFVPEVTARGRTALVAEVATLLEQPSPFLPVREYARGRRVALVGKHAIVWVSIPLGTAGTGPSGDAVPDEVGFEPSEVFSLYDQRHDVTVEMIDAEPLAGHVLYSSPADRPRLVDHLNQTVTFLRVWTPEALYLVNKHHVVRVLET